MPRELENAHVPVTHRVTPGRLSSCGWRDLHPPPLWPGGEEAVTQASLAGGHNSGRGGCRSPQAAGEAGQLAARSRALPGHVTALQVKSTAVLGT